MDMLCQILLLIGACASPLKRVYRINSIVLMLLLLNSFCLIQLFALFHQNLDLLQFCKQRKGSMGRCWIFEICLTDISVFFVCSLKYINVAMVTVLKNVTNVMTAIGEMYLFNKHHDKRVWAALFLMVSQVAALLLILLEVITTRMWTKLLWNCWYVLTSSLYLVMLLVNHS